MKSVSICNGGNIDIDIISTVIGFKSKITAYVDGKAYNAKSIMNVSVLKSATSIRFDIEGEDENAAENVIKLIFE